MQANVCENVSRSGWKVGRRIVELYVLLIGLKSCKFSGLGLVPLTLYSIVGELQRGLGCYLSKSISFQLPSVKAHRLGKTKGVPTFVANTKLGTGTYNKNNANGVYIYKN